MCEKGEAPLDSHYFPPFSNFLGTTEPNVTEVPTSYRDTALVWRVREEGRALSLGKDMEVTGERPSRVVSVPCPCAAMWPFSL